MAGFIQCPPLQYLYGVTSSWTCYPCSCLFCGYAYIEDSGGDEGLNLNFNVDFVAATNPYFVISGTRGESEKDRVEVYSGATLLYQSDCNFTPFNSGNVAIPSGTTTMRIVVIPNCLGGSSTYWDFKFLIFCS